VDQGTVQVVERFGKYDYFADAGCHFLCCCLGQTSAGYLSLRIQQLDVAVETKTKDNVFITLVVSVQYQVGGKDSYMDAFYKLTDSREQIRAYVFDVVRSSVPKIILDDVFTQKEEIAVNVKSELSKSMNSFGYNIINALVTDIAPDPKVKAAMNDINAAQRQRVAAQDRAEADKIMIVKQAEADAEAKHLAGTGIARQRQAIVNGLRESVMHFREDVQDIGSRDVLSMMMMTQYFDALRELGSGQNKSTIFVPHNPGAVGDVSNQIRMGFLQGAAPGMDNMKR
jgi:regulator of protease activity HflC (stomatin/prohibitin superfamily)